MTEALFTPRAARKDGPQRSEDRPDVAPQGDKREDVSDAPVSWIDSWLGAGARPVQAPSHAAWGQLVGDDGGRVVAARRAARPVQGKGRPGRQGPRERVLTGTVVQRFPCVKPAGLKLRLWARWVGVDRNKSLLGAVTRTQFPIIAYTGANGGGKTAAAVYDCLTTLAGRTWECANTGHRHLHGTDCRYNPVTGRGCNCELLGVPPTSAYDGPVPEGGATSGQYLVWSTTRLLGPDGTDHPLYRPLDSLAKLVYAEHAELLLDEVPGIADARDHQSVPPQLRKAIYECRRRDVVTRWTSVDFSAADARLRQVTQAVVYARGFAAIRTARSGVWTERRLLRWRTYDRADFEHFTAGTRDKVKALGQQWLWRPGHELERRYDTLAPVLALSVATESGTCLTCGGSRPRKKCGCEADEHGHELVPPPGSPGT